MDRSGLTFSLSPEGTHVNAVLNAGQFPVVIDPDELDALVEQLKAFQNRLQWRYGFPYWRYIRVKGRGKQSKKWHLLSKWESQALCSGGPSLGYGEQELTESTPDLWDGTVCRQCVATWTQLVQHGIVRYHHSSSARQGLEK